jgi:hypothetical protein
MKLGSTAIVANLRRLGAISVATLVHADENPSQPLENLRTGALGQHNLSAHFTSVWQTLLRGDTAFHYYYYKQLGCSRGVHLLNGWILLDLGTCHWTWATRLTKQVRQPCGSRTAAPAAMPSMQRTACCPAGGTHRAVSACHPCSGIRAATSQVQHMQQTSGGVVLEYGRVINSLNASRFAFQTPPDPREHQKPFMNQGAGFYPSGHHHFYTRHLYIAQYELAAFAALSLVYLIVLIYSQCGLFLDLFTSHRCGRADLPTCQMQTVSTATRLTWFAGCAVIVAEQAVADTASWAWQGVSVLRQPATFGSCMSWSTYEPPVFTLLSIISILAAMRLWKPPCTFGFPGSMCDARLALPLQPIIG